MALELKRVVVTNLIRVSYCCITVNFPFKQLYTSCKTEHFSYKGGCGARGYTYIKVFERRAGLGYR